MASNPMTATYSRRFSGAEQLRSGDEFTVRIAGDGKRCFETCVPSYVQATISQQCFVSVSVCLCLCLCVCVFVCLCAQIFNFVASIEKIT